MSDNVELLELVNSPSEYKIHNYAQETIILQHVHILTLRILALSLIKISICVYK
jgi:hypothetical protein